MKKNAKKVVAKKAARRRRPPSKASVFARAYGLPMSVIRSSQVHPNVACSSSEDIKGFLLGTVSAVARRCAASVLEGVVNGKGAFASMEVDEIRRIARFVRDLPSLVDRYLRDGNLTTWTSVQNRLELDAGSAGYARSVFGVFVLGFESAVSGYLKKTVPVVREWKGEKSPQFHKHFLSILHALHRVGGYTVGDALWIAEALWEEEEHHMVVLSDGGKPALIGWTLAKIGNLDVAVVRHFMTCHGVISALTYGDFAERYAEYVSRTSKVAEIRGRMKIVSHLVEGGLAPRDIAKTLGSPAAEALERADEHMLRVYGARALRGGVESVGQLPDYLFDPTPIVKEGAAGKLVAKYFSLQLYADNSLIRLQPAAPVGISEVDLSDAWVFVEAVAVKVGANAEKRAAALVATCADGLRDDLRSFRAAKDLEYPHKLALDCSKAVREDPHSFAATASAARELVGMVGPQNVVSLLKGSPWGIPFPADGFAEGADVGLAMRLLHHEFSLVVAGVTGMAILTASKCLVQWGQVLAGEHPRALKLLRLREWAGLAARVASEIRAYDIGYMDVYHVYRIFGGLEVFLTKTRSGEKKKAYRGALLWCLRNWGADADKRPTPTNNPGDLAEGLAWLAGTGRINEIAPRIKVSALEGLGAAVP